MLRGSAQSQLGETLSCQAAFLSLMKRLATVRVFHARPAFRSVFSNVIAAFMSPCERPTINWCEAGPVSPAGHPPSARSPGRVRLRLQVFNAAACEFLNSAAGRASRFSWAFLLEVSSTTIAQRLIHLQHHNAKSHCCQPRAEQCLVLCQKISRIDFWQVLHADNVLSSHTDSAKVKQARKPALITHNHAWF